MSEVKELYVWLLNTAKTLNINIYYSIDFSHNCNFHVHNIFEKEINNNFCIFPHNKINSYKKILNICSVFSVLCNIPNKDFKIFIKKICIFLSKNNQKDINLIHKILYNLKNFVSNQYIFDNLIHNILYNIIREAYLLSSIDIYYHINKSNSLIEHNSQINVTKTIKYFENYYLKLYDNLEIFSDYSVEKFYELSKTESNKIGHLKNTLCT
jgi:hypothetical protein